MMILTSAHSFVYGGVRPIRAYSYLLETVHDRRREILSNFSAALEILGGTIKIFRPSVNLVLYNHGYWLFGDLRSTVVWSHNKEQGLREGEEGGTMTPGPMGLKGPFFWRSLENPEKSVPFSLSVLDCTEPEMRNI